MEQIHPTPDPVGTGPYARLLTERAKTGEVAEGRESVILGGLYLKESSPARRFYWAVMLSVGVVVIIFSR